MPNRNVMFDINKFCANRTGANNCSQPIYLPQKTAGNDPSISDKMRYSQIVQNAVYKNVIIRQPITPEVRADLPTYYFPDGQVGTS